MCRRILVPCCIFFAAEAYALDATTARWYRAESWKTTREPCWSSKTVFALSRRVTPTWCSCAGQRGFSAGPVAATSVGSGAAETCWCVAPVAPRSR